MKMQKVLKKGLLSELTFALKVHSDQKLTQSSHFQILQLSHTENTKAMIVASRLYLKLAAELGSKHPHSAGFP